MATEIAFSNLNTWLQSQPENTIDTPYSLKITGLTASNLGSSFSSGSLGYIIRTNTNKYLDLSETELPTINSLYNSFSGCDYLVAAPALPSGITNLQDAFWSCDSLKQAPVIPDSVTNMNETFGNCLLLEYLPIIPSSVTNSNYCYTGLSDESKKHLKGTLSQVLSFQSNNQYAVSDCAWEVEIYEDDRITYKDTTYLVRMNGTSDWLSDWLENQSDNTPDTAYKLSIYDLSSSNVDNIKTILTGNNTKYVDLRYTALPSITNFENCETLVYSPQLPSGVTNLIDTFEGCKHLKASPVIPNTVTVMSQTFLNCTALETAPTLPSGLINMVGAFRGCESLVSAPTIPNGVTNIINSFNSCKSLTTPPEIPNSVTSMHLTFCDCIGLTSAPIIPNTVTTMSQTFEGCTNLTTVPIVPSSVTNGNKMFKNCTSLKKITEFQIPLATLKNNTYFQDMFLGCTSLESIGYVIKEENDWRVWRLKYGANTVEGKIYSADGSYESITQTSITKSDLKLPVLTDELWFPTESDADIDTLIQKMLTYRYGVFKKDTLEPDKKTMVLWADLPDQVKSNITLGTALCNTSASTADKIAVMSNYTLQNGNTFQITFTESNSSASALTLNINGTGAKALYLNNAVSSSSNYTLDAGTYLCRYNGTNYYIDTGYFVTNARSANSATTATQADYSRQGAYCNTAEGTAAKVANMRGYKLQSGATFPITFNKKNTAASALTLDVQNSGTSTGAKPLYINNSASSASNYSFEAGTYICRYNGTNYYIDTGYAVTQARTVGGYGVNNQTMTTQNDSLNALVTIAKKYAVGNSSNTKGYIQLGNNLKIQWGVTSTSSGLVLVDLSTSGYLSFNSKNSYVLVLGHERTSDISSGGGTDKCPEFYKISGTQFRIDQVNGSDRRTSWIAIGY